MGVDVGGIGDGEMTVLKVDEGRDLVARGVCWESGLLPGLLPVEESSMMAQPLAACCCGASVQSASGRVRVLE